MMIRVKTRTFFWKGACVLGAVILAGSVVGGAIIGLFPSAAYAAEQRIDAWWPVNGATVKGVQPFLGIVPDKSVEDYQMYWQVDGGGYVKMDSSYQNYPHKEATVDVSGWNWQTSGQYQISFIAQDLQGREIARTNMTINVEGKTVATNSASAATSPAPAPAPVLKKEVQIASPSAHQRVSGTQSFKATLSNADASSYKMYWSVDGGNENYMENNESLIDFSGWTWKGEGPYTIRFVAKDNSGNFIADASRPITVGQNQITLNISAPITTSVVTAPVEVTLPVITSASGLYVDPNNPALTQAATWTASRPADAAIMSKLASESSGIWLGGWNKDVKADVEKAMASAKTQNSIPVFVAYNIPNRDCGSYSAGGESSKDAYLSWIKKVSAGLANGSSIVILEPDALAGIDCLWGQTKEDRYTMLSSALDIFKANNPGAKVYLDAGHSNWINDNDMAARLTKAGISKAAGFSLNVSNYIRTNENIDYGKRVSEKAGNAHFVIDTSRNGNGGNGEWCNPSDRALGEKPTLNTGNALIDAFLWIKKPGESDGNCNGGPNAGEWWPEYALALAKKAGY